MTLKPVLLEEIDDSNLAKEVILDDENLYVGIVLRRELVAMLH